MSRRGSSTRSVVLAWACAMGPGAGACQDDAPEESGPRLVEEVSLELSSGGTAPGRVYELAVPARRGTAEPGTLSIAYLRVAGPRPDEPVNVFLGSDPGDSGVEFVTNLLRVGGSSLLDLLGGDVVGVDTRGVGRALPNLDVARGFGFPASAPADPAKYLELMQTVCGSVVEELREDGVDLDAFHHVEIAADVRDVLGALGAPEGCRLWARDHGALVALEAVRGDPGRVRALILVSAEGPDQGLRLPSQYEDGLAGLAKRAGEDPALAAAVPDLLVLTRRLLKRLEQAPARSTATDPATGAEVEVQIGRFDVELLLVQRLGDQRLERSLPALLHAMDRGDFAEAATVVLSTRADLGVGSALRWTTACAAGASPERLRSVEADRKALGARGLLTGAATFPFPAIASAWPVAALDAATRAPVKTSVPTLLIVGALDVGSPPSYARELLAHLSGGRLVVVQNAGSEVALGTNPRLRETVTAFLAGKDLPREASVPSPPIPLAPPWAR